jgi:hypothetical protein
LEGEGGFEEEELGMREMLWRRRTLLSVGEEDGEVGLAEEAEAARGGNDAINWAVMRWRQVDGGQFSVGPTFQPPRRNDNDCIRGGTEEPGEVRARLEVLCCVGLRR